MPGKNFKFYNTLYEFFLNGAKPENAVGFFSALIPQGYEAAVELWEFILTVNPPEKTDEIASKAFCDGVLGAFLKAGRQKTLPMLKQNGAIAKRVFSAAPTALANSGFSLLADLICAQKFEDAQFFFELIVKNPASEKITADTERLYNFIFDKFKADGGRINIPKRIAAFLISCAEKIKGPKSLLLIQQVKVLI
jgi:hypothetical protein